MSEILSHESFCPVLMITKEPMVTFTTRANCNVKLGWAKVLSNKHILAIRYNIILHIDCNNIMCVGYFGTPTYTHSINFFIFLNYCSPISNIITSIQNAMYAAYFTLS